LSKYCYYISKSSQINRNKYFQFTQEKNIGWKMSFYLFIAISFYLFIPILCDKILCVKKATRRAKMSCINKSLGRYSFIFSPYIGGLFQYHSRSENGQRCTPLRENKINDYRSDDNEWKLGHSEAAPPGVNFINLLTYSFFMLRYSISTKRQSRHQGLISSTLNVQIFCMNVVSAAFSTYM